jgi:hypothetical protein
VVGAAVAAFWALNAEPVLAKLSAAELSISGRMVTKDMDFSFGKLSEPGNALPPPCARAAEGMHQATGVKPIQAAKTVRGPDRNDMVIDFR